MNLSSQWPEHKPLEAGWRITDFDVLNPAVAKAMKAQGMKSFVHLMDRVEWILEQPRMREYFKGVRPVYQTLHTMVAKRNASDQALIFSLDKSSYARYATLVAMALECEEEELFGPPPAVLERGGECLETLEAFSPSDPEGAYEKSEMARYLHGAMLKLSPREERALRRRFGFAGPEQDRYTIARECDLTHERIRQMEVGSLRALAHPGKKLRRHLDPGEAVQRGHEAPAVAVWGEPAALLENS
jgi:hypothetical protein